MPTSGSVVVNGKGEIFGLTFVKLASIVDFPAFVFPTSTAWMSSFFIPFLVAPFFFCFSFWLVSFLRRVFSCARRFSAPLWLGATEIIFLSFSILSSSVCASAYSFSAAMYSG